jgi:hypothetical protein
VSLIPPLQPRRVPGTLRVHGASDPAAQRVPVHYGCTVSLIPEHSEYPVHYGCTVSLILQHCEYPVYPLHYGCTVSFIPEHGHFSSVLNTSNAKSKLWCLRTAEYGLADNARRVI